MTSIVSSFASASALVVGDLMLDRYVWGTADRISPEAPVAVVRVRERSARPGGAANVAANVAALGGAVTVAGIVGADGDGAVLTEALAALGVDITAVLADQHRLTTTKTRFYAHGQQLLRIDDEATEPADSATQAALVERVSAALARSDVVVLSDYAKGVVTRELADGIIDAARGQGKPVLVDPKGRDYEKYRGATLITPNLAELGRAVNAELTSEQEIIDAARAISARLGETTAVLVTRGADGMTLIEGDAAYHLPAAARAVYDVTGAGDTVLACLAVAIGAGADLRGAADLANRAAAIAVERVGTAMVTGDDLRQALAT